MRRVNLSQGSSDWHLWRAGGLGGSDVAAIIGASIWETRDGLLLKKAAHRGQIRTTDKNKSPAMMRGINEEPRVRDEYCALLGVKVIPACVIDDEHDFMRASLDGLDDSGRLVVEIKCPNNGDHATALAGTVPAKYWPQVQHQLRVTGAPMLHYVSWTDRPPFSKADQLKVLPVKPSPEYIAYLVEEEVKFWQDLLALIEKKKSEKLLASSTRSRV